MISIKQIFDRIATRFVRNRLTKSLNKIKGGEIFIEINEFKGIFKMDARSHIFKRVLIFNDFEPKNAILVNKYTNGKDFIDIGANVGLDSVLFSKIALDEKQKILSIEPNPSAINFLELNIKNNFNNPNRSIIYKGIATTSEGIYNLNFIEGLSEYSSVNKIAHPTVKDEKIIQQNVPGNTIDNLVKQYNLQPGFLKIDVEGGEQDVLKGSFDTIEKYRPIILIEINDFESLNESISAFYIEFFNRINYKLLNLNLSKAKMPLVGDFICLPNEYEIT